MFNDLQALGYGLVVFSVIIGVGTVVLVNFGGSTANCAGLTSCGTGGVWNSTGETCSNATSSSCGTPNTASYTNTNYLTTQLGSGGLAGWTPAIIAIAIGLMFLGAFMVRGSKKGRY